MAKMNPGDLSEKKPDRSNEDLAMVGLKLGMQSTYAIIGGLVVLIIAELIALVISGKELISGQALVYIVLIVALALIVYYAFIYNRSLKFGYKLPPGLGGEEGSFDIPKDDDKKENTKGDAHEPG